MTMPFRVNRRRLTQCSRKAGSLRRVWRGVPECWQAAPRLLPIVVWRAGSPSRVSRLPGKGVAFCRSHAQLPVLKIPYPCSMNSSAFQSKQQKEIQTMLARMMGFASLALGFALSGCGGSSGTGTPAVSSPPTPTVSSPRSLPEDGLKMTAASAAMAARSIPSPGSVTQSSNIDSNTGATADRVSVAYSNDTFRFTQEAGERWEIGTGNAEPWDEGLGAQDVIGLVRQEDDGQRILIAYTRAPEGGGTDWLAAGIWAFVPNSEQADDYEFGAFADGVSFPQASLQALIGDATYTGQAVGVYYAQSPNDDGEASPFGADVDLTANFGGTGDLGSISGTISGVETESGSPLDATLTPGTASIGDSDSGFFTGNTSMTFGGRSYDGEWGGQFFGSSATDTPSFVAGTFGATTGEGGATGSLVGAFGAERVAQ